MLNHTSCLHHEIKTIVSFISKKSLSYFRLETNKGSYEYKITFHSFLAQIKTIKDIEEVFPQHKHFFIVQENILVPFYIAMLALTRKEPFARDFALTLLYEELEKPEVLDLIENNNLYSLVQLSKDVAGCNIYRYA